MVSLRRRVTGRLQSVRAVLSGQGRMVDDEVRAAALDTSSRGRLEPPLQTSRNNRHARMHARRGGSHFHCAIPPPSFPFLPFCLPVRLSSLLSLKFADCLRGSPAERGGETLHTSHLQCHFSSVPSFCSTPPALLCTFPSHLIPPVSAILRLQHPAPSLREENQGRSLPSLFLSHPRCLCSDSTPPSLSFLFLLPSPPPLTLSVRVSACLLT